jgi:hypothetical protein
MKTNDKQKMKADEAGFLFILVLGLLIIIPMLGDYLGKYGGGIAMLAGSILGLMTYLIAFRNRLRGRGQLQAMAILAATSFVVSAVGAAAFLLVRTHWI